MSGISISKCLRRLKNAKNDTEKFAALLMVGIKILKFHDGGGLKSSVHSHLLFGQLFRGLKSSTMDCCRLSY